MAPGRWFPGAARPAAAPALVIFGSDQGLCGQFNERIVAHAQDILEEQHIALSDCYVLAVGSRVVGHLEGTGCRLEDTLFLPASHQGFGTLVQRLLLRIDALRETRGTDRVLLFHHRPTESTSYRPEYRQLLPYPDEMGAIPAGTTLAHPLPAHVPGGADGSVRRSGPPVPVGAAVPGPGGESDE